MKNLNGIAKGQTPKLGWSFNPAIGLWTQQPKQNNKMQNDKIIHGQIVRKSVSHKGMWDILETRCGKPTGNTSFTGTMKEVRAAIKEGNRIGKHAERHVCC